MLFTASHPRPPRNALRPAGSRLPRNPKAARLNAIWLRPVRGPHEVSTPWKTAPSTLPRTSAATACPKLSPKTRTARIPTNTVANSMFGEVHTQARW
jgi:hypothetical protein